MLDRHGLEQPDPMSPPFPIPPSVPALDLAEGCASASARSTSTCSTRRGTPRGRSACSSTEERLLFTGDTLFAGGWGRTDLPGGDAEQMVESLARLATLEDGLTVLPGHGPETTHRARAALAGARRPGPALPW